jgi:hypothetical protein
MTRSIRLIPLKCIQCQAPLPAKADEIAWRCTTCGAGQRLGEDKLLPLDIHFAEAQGQAWRPYWVFEGSVTIVRRQTQRGSGRGFDWSKVKHWWLPAFTLKIEQAQQIAVQLTRTQPVMSSVPTPPGVAITGCTLSPEDARKLAEFVVLSLEAGQPDWLQSIDFRLDLGQPVLWMLSQ